VPGVQGIEGNREIARKGTYLFTVQGKDWKWSEACRDPGEKRIELSCISVYGDSEGTKHTFELTEAFSLGQQEVYTL